MRVWLTNEKYIFNLLFAGDQVVIAQDKEDIECLIRKLFYTYSMESKHQFKEKWKLNFWHEVRSCFRRKKDKNVSNFKYLGSKIQKREKLKEKLI